MKTQINVDQMTGDARSEEIAETRRGLHEARHLPGYIYTSPEIFAEEKERIFMVDWLCMARVEEFPNLGDYKTFDVMGDPIAIARGPDGLSAFSNICAHRGVEVFQGQGNGKSFSCPYHGWTYDLEGKLLGAPYMKENQSFDPKVCRLPPLKLDTWAGFVFVNFNMDAPPLSTHVADFAADFDFLRMGELRLAPAPVRPKSEGGGRERGRGEQKCNWKLFVENIVDEYHMAVAHSTTNGRFLTDNSKFTLHDNGGYMWEYDAGPSTLTGEALFDPIPWLVDQRERFSISGFLRPNLTLFGRAANLNAIVTWPVAPDRTRVAGYFLLPEESLADPEYETKMNSYRETSARTVAEDTFLIASLQRAMSAKRFTPGYMARQEIGVHHIISHYVERMFGTA
mgnify:CR=1 FL=1